jgi:hypothetical protein
LQFLLSPKKLAYVSAIIPSPVQNFANVDILGTSIGLGLGPGLAQGVHMIVKKSEIRPRVPLRHNLPQLLLSGFLNDVNMDS